MAQSLDIRALGLITDPNQYDQPPGALSRALNVVIRRAGVIEPRPGFKDGTQFTVTSRQGETLFPYDGEYVIVSYDTNGANWETERKNGTDILDENSAKLDYDDPSKISAIEAAGNLYITTKSGVRRISDISDTVAYRTGMTRAFPGALNTTATGGNAWLVTTNAVAYRCLFVREVNGRELRGPPSGRFFYDNETGTTINLTWDIPVPDDVIAGDVLELYRSPAVAGTIADTSDELRSVLTHRVTSAEVTAGVITVTDDTAEVSRGADLYTNATQQGLLQENTRPPKADTVALYNDMVFYGATEFTHRRTVTLSQGEIVSGNTDQRFQQHVHNGVTSLGSATISGVTGFSGLEVGQYVSDAATGPLNAGTNIDSLSIINSLNPGASQVVMNKNSLQASGGSFSIDFSDFISIGGRVYFCWDSNDVTNRLFDCTGDGAQAAANLAYVVARDTGADFYVHPIQGNTADDIVLLIFRRTTSGAQFAVNATKSSLWAPTLDDTGTDVQSTTDNKPNGLFYSKLGQPESVPEANSGAPGGENEPILKLVSLRDSLLVFKTDGVWRVSGQTPETLRIDRVDADLTLINPRAVDVLDNKAIAWTSRGIVAVDDFSYQQISDYPLESTFEVIQSDMLGKIRDSLNNEPDRQGIFLVAHYDRDEFYVGVPDDAATQFTNDIYVFNTKTRAWTRWVPPVLSAFWLFRGAAVDPVTNQLQFVGWEVTGTELRVVEERITPDATLGLDQLRADEDYSVTINTVTGTADAQTITVAAGSGWSPVTGDAIVRSGVVAIVTSITSPTVVVARAPSLLTTGAATAYISFDSEVWWVVRSAENPGLDKFWRDSSFAFEDIKNVGTINVSYTNNLNETGSNIAVTTNAVAGDGDEVYRVLVDTDHSRGVALRPRLSIQSALGEWQLSSLSLVYELMSDRVGR